MKWITWTENYLLIKPAICGLPPIAMIEMEMLRLFIAIAVPGNIKEKIREIISQIQPAFRGNRDIRWVTEENWHFTVSFLGYEPEDVVPIIEKSMIELPPLLKTNEKITIEFEKLVYGPDDRQGNMRRMIWLTGNSETSQKLGQIKETLEKRLVANGVKWTRHDYGSFNAHLNLARFSPISLSNLPVIGKNIVLSYQAESLDLIRSRLRKSGAVYENLFKIDF